MTKHIFLLLCCSLLSLSALSGNESFEGKWWATDRAAMAKYTSITIGEDTISWGGGNPYNPPCESTYSLVEQAVSDHYPDNIMSRDKNWEYRIYKLKITPSTCTVKNAYFLFAIPISKDHYAEVVVYDANEEVVGGHSFYKNE